jgi:hypothetical protein
MKTSTTLMVAGAAAAAGSADDQAAAALGTCSCNTIARWRPFFLHFPGRIITQHHQHFSLSAAQVLLIPNNLFYLHCSSVFNIFSSASALR